jgi:hypothetical protein
MQISAPSFFPPSRAAVFGSSETVETLLSRVVKVRPMKRIRIDSSWAGGWSMSVPPYPACSQSDECPIDGGNRNGIGVIGARYWRGLALLD